MEKKIKAATMAYFDEKELKYSNVEERVLRIDFALENVKEVAIFILFDEDEDFRLSMTSSDLLNFPEDKMAEALLLLNELNNSYRWVKFCIDEDRDLLVRTDAIVSEETAGKELLELTLRMSSIIDDAWPKIMRMRFS